MKSAKSILAGIILLVLPALLFAQDVKKKTEVIFIQTSAICDECKERIESAVFALKGVKKVELNLDDSKLMVEYAGEKVSDAEIRTAVVMAGYDADEMTADVKAYASLPKCCQKDAKKH